MRADVPAFRTRYPLRAIVMVVLAALFVLAELAALSLFLMPLIPLVPVFVMIMLGNACVLSAIVSHAASLGRIEPVRKRLAETQSPAPRSEPVEADA